MVEEKKNGEGKGGIYFEKRNIFLRRRRKMEKEKEENIWRRKMLPKRDKQKKKEKKGYSANGPWKAEMSNWTFLGCSYEYPLYINDLRIGSVSLHSKMQHFSSFSHAAAQDLKS